MNGKITLSNKLKGAVTMANTIINGGASPYPKSASGDIITITDGADNTPLKSCVVNIEPVQDLHGYDNPWPAGGGFNKLNITDLTPIKGENGITFTVNANGTVTANGTATSQCQIYWQLPKERAATYGGLKAAIPSTGEGTLYLELAGTPYTHFLQSPAYIVDNSIADVTQMVNCIWRIPQGTTLSNYTYGPMLYDASLPTPTSFSPYSNISPISGWSEVKVWVKPTYDTSLTPTATIPLGQTVYGGTLDVVRGKLILTHAYWTDNGTANWILNADGSAYTWYTPASPLSVQETDGCACNYGPYEISFYGISVFARANGLISLGKGWGSIYADVTALKAAFAATPIQIVYKLATPIEVDLTPQTIKTLLGINNIWADAGEMSIEYYPAAASIVAVQNRSTKMYVSIPLGMIRYETYQITPQQTIDLDSYRSENGNLLRNPVATKCKLEFNTPLMTDTQWAEIWNIIKAGFNNNTERKLKLKYYDTLSATYKTGYFYVPDVQTTIRNIEEGPGVINYQEIRLAFIEY